MNMCKEFVVVVSGSREYSNIQKIYNELQNILDEHNNVVIVEGGANGADAIAALFAKEKGIKLLTFNADWDKYKKAAGGIRNQQMLDECNPDLVIAFPLPKSKGTYDMIRRANIDGYNLKVIQ